MTDQEEEKKRKRIAAIVTITFHVVALILFLIFGLTQPVPLPEDQGASVEFGWDDSGDGEAIAQTEITQPVQEIAESTPVQEVTEEVVEEEVVTDEESEVAVPEQKEEVKPQEEAEQEEPVEEPEPELDDRLKNALNSINSPNNIGSSKGEDGDSGNQGNPSGTNGKGVLGGGSGSWQLDGRSMMPGYGTKIRDTKEEGIVFKVSSMKEPVFTGKTICFDDPRGIVTAVEERRIQPGSVIVLRYWGPVASGMPEVLVATAALAVPELDGKVAFISDTRVSGVSHGAIGVHCAPEAAVGGPIACVEDGDEISFDLTAGSITVNLTDEEIAKRRAALPPWKPRDPRRGYLSDFCATTAQASDGCVSAAFLSDD